MESAAATSFSDQERPSLLPKDIHTTYRLHAGHHQGNHFPIHPKQRHKRLTPQSSLLRLKRGSDSQSLESAAGSRHDLIACERLRGTIEIRLIRTLRLGNPNCLRLTSNR